MPQNLHNDLHNDDLHKLIGGYATGTLSEAQRRQLFEAALDDQALFDELARDQALKELLEAPGVKQRLLATIEVRPAREWWKHPLPWAMGGFAMAVSAVLLAIVYFTPSGSRPVEVAQFQAPARPAPVTAESPAASRDAASAAPQVQNEPKRKSPEPVRRPAEQAAPSGGGGGGGPKAKAEAEGTQPAPPALQNEPKQGQALDKTASGVVGGYAGAANSVGALSAPAAAAPPVASAKARSMSAARMAATPAGRLAFDYSIYDSVLRIIPAADGYLLVRATVHDDDRVVLRTSHVKENSPVELSVPEGATFLAIVLSPRPVPEESTENLPANVAARKDMSGHLEDPRPTLTSRLQVRIQLGGK